MRVTSSSTTTAAFAENLAEILRDAGDEVDVAAAAPTRSSASRAQRFDALVTDMRMPVMGGAELVHELRARRPGPAGDRDHRLHRRRRPRGRAARGAARDAAQAGAVPRLLELLGSARRDGLVALVEDDAGLPTT